MHVCIWYYAAASTNIRFQLKFDILISGRKYNRGRYVHFSTENLVKQKIEITKRD